MLHKLLVFSLLLSVCIASYVQVQEDLPRFPERSRPFGLIPEDDYEVIQKYAQAYMSGTFHGMIAEDAYNLTQFGMIVDVRSEAAYLAGHVPGAVNIPYAVLADQDNLDLLPTVTAWLSSHLILSRTNPSWLFVTLDILLHRQLLFSTWYCFAQQHLLIFHS